MSKSVRIAGLLFLSGFCALVYQTVWLRELRLIMGASTPATATVLAIFMGGLGIGGLYLGRRADRVKRPLAFYAFLEAGIAGLSAITPFILDAGRSVYLGAGGTLVLGTFGGTILRMVISVVVLITPTFLMGGTLPAAARAARSPADVSNKNLALLYGANTLGAVAGAVLSTFALLELFGNRRTLWVACLINLIVFVLARSQSRKVEAVPDSQDQTLQPAGKADTPRFVAGVVPAPGWFVLMAATVTGLVFFLMEIVWYRMLGPILGGTTFTFGTILAVALLGIGTGGIIYSLKPNRLPTLNSFAWTCALEALFLIIPYALGDRIAEAALALRTFGFMGFWGFVAGWVFIAAIVILPVSVIAGYQFPLLISLLNPMDERFAWKIGLTYGFNTAGSIAGSLLGGFGLLPLLTAPGAWKLTAVLLVAMSLVTAFIAVRQRIAAPLSAAFLVFVFVAALPVLLSFSEGPTAVWRHSGIGAGRAYVLAEKIPISPYRAWKRERNEGIIREWDGVESSVALGSFEGLAFLVNGKSDGHSLSDAGTQIMAGLIAAVLHDNARTSFVVGLGTGSTAGWLAAVPSMERVDVAEIEPVITKVAEACAAVNHEAMKNPKIKVIIGDGREILMSSPRTYDIIASEPSNPYRAGISSLFTLNFYRAVASRLNRGGIFVHWVQAYEIDASSVWTIYTTLTEVFPYVETWRTTGGDITLLASMEPFQFNVPRLRKRVSSPPYSEALRYAWHVDSLEGFLSRRIAGSELAQRIHSLPLKTVNTDDQNHLEFDFARSVGLQRNFSADQIYTEGRKFQDFKSLLDDPGVDRTEVERRRLKMISFGQRDTSVIAAEEGRVKANFDQAISAEDWTLARQILRRNNDRLPFDTNRALLPIVFMEAEDPGAERTIAKHHLYSPEEALALRALYNVRKERWDQALAESLEFVAALRKNPWPSELVVDRLFPEFPVIAKNMQDGTGKLMEALLQGPFAVYAYEKQRYEAAFLLARSDGGSDSCKLIRKQRYYFNAGNIEYLKYLGGCRDNDESTKKRLASEIRQLKEDESLSFGQLMGYLAREGKKK